jgi:hypothetical protein
MIISCCCSGRYFALLRFDVNVINILCTAVDPESVKNTVRSSVSFYDVRPYKERFADFDKLNMVKLKLLSEVWF